MKTAEDIIHEIERNNVTISNLLSDNVKLARELKELRPEAWDWISVASACKLWDISPAMMYAKINAGKLHTKRFERKIYVSKSEVMSINDQQA